MPNIQSGNILSKYSLEIPHNSRVEKNSKLMEVDYFIVIKKLSIRKGELLTQGHSSIFLPSALCLSVSLSLFLPLSHTHTHSLSHTDLSPIPAGLWGWLSLRLLWFLRELQSWPWVAYLSAGSFLPGVWLVPALAVWAQWKGGLLIPSISLNAKILLIYLNIIERDRDNPWRIDLCYLVSTKNSTLLCLKIFSLFPSALLCEGERQV